MEFERGAVKLVRTRFRRDDDLPPRLPPELRRVCAREHAELADRIEDRPVQRLVGGLVIIVDSIQQVLVRDLAVARDVETAPETEVRALCRRVDIRLKLRQLQIVASVQRKLDDFFLFYNVAHGRILARNQGRGSADTDLLSQASSSQSDVEACFLPGLEQNAASNLSIESRLLHGERVFAGPQLR